MLGFINLSLFGENSMWIVIALAAAAAAVSYFASKSPAQALSTGTNVARSVLKFRDVLRGEGLGRVGDLLVDLFEGKPAEVLKKIDQWWNDELEDDAATRSFFDQLFGAQLEKACKDSECRERALQKLASDQATYERMRQIVLERERAAAPTSP